MKTIHIIGAGGPAGVGMTRCLKGSYEVFGWDISPWARIMAECPLTQNGPHDMVIPIPDTAVKAWSGTGGPLFLPPISHIEICQDKAKCAEVLGDLAPKTYWVRDTVGAGGKGAQMASEYLPGRNVSVEIVFGDDGLADDFFIKERLSYRVGSIEPVNGIGTSAVSVCIWDDSIQQIALKSVVNIGLHTGENPRGVYAVDMKQAEDGTFKVTEINAGRFLTASYPYFYKTGYNLPLRMAQYFLDDDRSPLPDYPEGWELVWQLGQEPRLFPSDITKDWK